MKIKSNIYRCVCLLFAALFIATSSAVAEFRPYVSVKGGIDGLTVDGKFSIYGPLLMQPGRYNKHIGGGRIAMGLSTSVDGTRHWGTLRTEFEFGFFGENKKIYTSNSFWGGSNFPATLPIEFIIKQNMTFSFNVYFDLDTGTQFMPYIGCGLGYANVKSEILNSGGGTYRLPFEGKILWQISAGVSYAFNDRIALDLGYRFTRLPSISGDFVYPLNASGGGPICPRINLSMHEILAGLRYTF
jgi:opacity protein-like surface antigen